MKHLARAIAASIRGKAQADFEHYMRLSESTSSLAFKLWCLDKAADARSLVGDAYMRKRLDGLCDWDKRAAGIER